MAEQFFQPDQLATRNEAARLLDIRPDTVTLWLRRGHLERARKGNKWRITYRSIRAAGNGDNVFVKKGPFYDQNRALTEKWREIGKEAYIAVLEKALLAEEEKKNG